MRLPLFALSAGLLLTACAGGVAPGSTPAPVAGIPVQNWTVDVQRPLSRDIFLRNDDSVDRVITDLQIFACENLRQVCQVYTPNVIIPAGKTVKAMRLSPEKTTLPWKYQYLFHTRAVRAPAPMTTTTSVPTTVSFFSRTGMLPYVGLSNVEEFKPRVAAPTSAGQCSRNQEGRGPAGGRILTLLYFGKRPDEVSLAIVDLDASDRPVLFTLNRGSSRVPPGSPGTDSLPPRTIISIRVAQNIVELINEGGNKPPEYFTATGPGIMTAASLGHPGELMARVLSECGGK